MSQSRAWESEGSAASWNSHLAFARQQESQFQQQLQDHANEAKINPVLNPSLDKGEALRKEIEDTKNTIVFLSTKAREWFKIRQDKCREYVIEYKRLEKKRASLWTGKDKAVAADMVTLTPMADTCQYYYGMYNALNIELNHNKELLKTLNNIYSKYNKSPNDFIPIYQFVKKTNFDINNIILRPSIHNRAPENAITERGNFHPLINPLFGGQRRYKNIRRNTIKRVNSKKHKRKTRYVK